MTDRLSSQLEGCIFTLLNKMLTIQRQNAVVGSKSAKYYYLAFFIRNLYEKYAFKVWL